MEDVYILNATDKNVHTRVFGHYFDIPANSVKRFRKEFGEFLHETKGYLGLIAVPESMNDHNKVEEDGKVVLFRESKKGSPQFLALRNAAIDKRVAHLNGIVQNLKQSVAEDLAARELKIDPLLLASDGEEAAMEELHGYQIAADDAQKQRLERLRKLDRQIVASSNAKANQKA